MAEVMEKIDFRLIINEERLPPQDSNRSYVSRVVVKSIVVGGILGTSRMNHNRDGLSRQGDTMNDGMVFGSTTEHVESLPGEDGPRPRRDPALSAPHDAERAGLPVRE